MFAKIFLLLFYFFNPQNGLIKDKYFSFYFEDSFYIVENDSIFSTKNGQYYVGIPHDIQWTDFNFNSVNMEDHVLLISDGGGLVYRFKDNEIQRLDKSFNHRNKYGSFDFEYQNKVFSYAGYGLFTNSSKLTFYQRDSKQWFDFLYHPDSEFPKGRRRPIGQIFDSTLYIGGGMFESANQNLALETIYLGDFWKLDLTTHKWTYLGEGNFGSTFVPENLFSLYTKSIPYKGGRLIIYRNSINLVDIKNNSFTNFPNANTNLYSDVSRIIYNPNSDLFLLPVTNHDSGFEQFSFIIAANFIGMPEVSKQLYKPTFNYLNFIIGLGVFLIIIIVIILKPIKLTKNKLLYNLGQIQNELNDEEFKIFKFILDQHPQPATFPNILNFYEPSLSYESRIKKLRLTLTRIDEVSSKYAKRKVLVFSKNKNDKRIKQVSFLDIPG